MSKPEHRFHDDGDKYTCGACGRSWCGLCDPTPAARCPFEYEHEEEEAPPTLTEEAERLLSYWEIHGSNPDAVAAWAVSDMLGILRLIVDAE